MKTFKTITLITLMILGYLGCRKGEMGARMLVNMTDAPGNYRSVNIDLKKVMIHYQNAPESKWIELRSYPGIYDLLTLRNNATAFIAESEALPVGKVSQIRLELGDNNSVVTNEGITRTLKIPSSATSGLKINMHQNVNFNRTVTVTLDFDAESSVKVDGNGQYSLEPVIKVKQVIMN